MLKGARLLPSIQRLSSRFPLIMTLLLALALLSIDVAAKNRPSARGSESLPNDLGAGLNPVNVVEPAVDGYVLPQVECEVSSDSVVSGDAPTLSANAVSPDGAEIVAYRFTTMAGRIDGAGATATLDTMGLPQGQVVVTVLVTDALHRVGEANCILGVQQAPPPPTCSKINSIQFPDLKRPWRVDNTAKAILDNVASRLKSDPTARIVMVGFADREKVPPNKAGTEPHSTNLAGQRSVNAQSYLVTQQGIDRIRVEVRTGAGKQKVVDIIWVPMGVDEKGCSDLRQTTLVGGDVKPTDSSIPMPRSKNKTGKQQ